MKTILIAASLLALSAPLAKANQLTYQVSLYSTDAGETIFKGRVQVHVNPNTKTVKIPSLGARGTVHNGHFTVTGSRVAGPIEGRFHNNRRTVTGTAGSNTFVGSKNKGGSKNNR